MIRQVPVELVQYHNPDKLGRRPTYHRDRVGVFWRGNRSVPNGARVWLVVGETNEGTKRYWLWYWFIADQVDQVEKRASGSRHTRFAPPVEIGHLPWFREFQRFMGNFGRGLSPLRNRDVVNFEAAVGARIPTVRPPLNPSSTLQGSGFGAFKLNLEVERAAVAVVTKRLKLEGWRVTSVEANKCGYDLLCERGSRERHIEVKGTTAAVSSCILTENEMRSAKADSNWELVIVADVLERPRLNFCSGRDMDTRFNAEPIAYRLIAKNVPSRRA
jgi:hypothetical protein